MNLANLGLAAMNAAQNRLSVTGHNLNNVDTEGYNRQRVLSSTAGATATGAGYIGRGVQAVTIQRAYDKFLSDQLTQAQTQGAALIAYGNEITQVNNLFGDPTVGISPALQKFFEGINAVASEPADPAARQELLGRAGSLVNQINNANAFLDAQRGNINTQITTEVTQINSYLNRIRDLNEQVVMANANATGHVPNDLLDQRDQLVKEFSQLVGAQSVEHGDGTISLTIGNGQIVLSGNTVYPLHAVASAADPSRTVVAYSSIDGQGGMTPVELRESSITGGSLGGLMSYRRESLDAVQNDLGRLAAGLAMAVNDIHGSGYLADGTQGGNFFNLGPTTAISHADNTAGGTSITATMVPGDAGNLKASDYSIAFDGTQYTVTRLSDNAVVGQAAAPASSMTFDGLEISFTGGAPQQGDTWRLQPMRQAGASLSLALTAPDQIAAAGPGGGTANGETALKLAKLQTERVLAGGTMNLNESYSQIVSRVAVQTQQNGTAAKAQASLIQQNFAAQQAVSGVNENEELVNLDRYLQQFRAASRMIEVSTSVFDTLLSLRT